MACLLPTARSNRREFIGQLFSDGRNGLLVVKPSQPFFGVARHERHFDVTDGSIDINLDPTPAGVTYLVAYKEKGDIRKTDFTLKWRVPDREAYDITPGATQASSTASVVQSATVYERVQLRRAASELGDALEEQVRLESSLLSAQQRISVLEEQLRDFRGVSEEAQCLATEQSLRWLSKLRLRCRLFMSIDPYLLLL